MTTIDTLKNCDPNDVKCGIQMFGTVKVWEKWQIVIPKEVRDILGVKPGDTMLVTTKHGKAIGLIKQEDLQEFISYLQEELNSRKKF